MSSGSPLRTTLTLLLVAAQRRAEEFEFAVYEVIGRLVDLANWSDERRADLYATVAESVKADDRLTVIERKVGHALHLNDQRFPNG